MRYLLTVLALTLSSSLFSQIHVGVFSGISNYYGDLNDKLFNRSKLALGVTAAYEVSDRLLLRGGVTVGSVEGADKYSGSDWLIKNRNLSFNSGLSEFSIVAELTTFNLYNIRWSPYVFGGFSVFHFNPYTYDSSNNKVFLQPLSTEGQGLPEYGRRNYSLTDLALPYGIGIKYNLTDRLRLGLELGLRKTFTDYIDDVSTSYVDESVLLARRGEQAVDFSYRADEAGGSASYPAKGYERGNAKRDDGFYFTGLHITYRFAGSGHQKNGGYKIKNCPPVPQ